MIDARFEIDKLKQILRQKNISEDAIQSICGDIARDISSATADLLADAMIEAVSAGGDVSSSEFASEVISIRNGHTFNVDTSSGKQDFSEPPFPMLPKLLRNAKVSRKGDLYKVIPVSKKSNASSAVTTEAAIRNINEARQLAKDERDARDKGNITTGTPDPMAGMQILAAIQGSGRPSPQKKESRTREGSITYRTASSKQDAAVSWVMPAKNANLTDALRNINNNLQDSIDRVILDIVNRYSGMY
jgi:hypothetical protein